MNSAYSIPESRSPFSVPVLKTFFSWKSGIFGMTNVSPYIVWEAAIAVCIFNHSSPLFSAHPPVCGMASFCFSHAPLSIVSISCASSSHQNFCGHLFFLSDTDDTCWQAAKEMNMRSCSAAEHLQSLGLMHLSKQTYNINAVVSMTLILTKRECNYSN